MPECVEFPPNVVWAALGLAAASCVEVAARHRARSAGEAGELGVALALEPDDLLGGEILGPWLPDRGVVGLPQRVDASDGLPRGRGPLGGGRVIRDVARPRQAFIKRGT